MKHVVPPSPPTSYHTVCGVIGIYINCLSVAVLNPSVSGSRREADLISMFCQDCGPGGLVRADAGPSEMPGRLVRGIFVAREAFQSSFWAPEELVLDPKRRP